MSEYRKIKKGQNTLDVQNEIWRKRVKEFEKTKGLTRGELIRRATINSGKTRPIRRK